MLFKGFAITAWILSSRTCFYLIVKHDFPGVEAVKRRCPNTMSSSCIFGGVHLQFPHWVFPALRQPSNLVYSSVTEGLVVNCWAAHSKVPPTHLLQLCMAECSNRRCIVASCSAWSLLKWFGDSSQVHPLHLQCKTTCTIAACSVGHGTTTQQKGTTSGLTSSPRTFVVRSEITTGAVKRNKILARRKTCCRVCLPRKLFLMINHASWIFSFVCECVYI